MLESVLYRLTVIAPSRVGLHKSCLITQEFIITSTLSYDTQSELNSVMVVLSCMVTCGNPIITVSDWTFDFTDTVISDQNLMLRCHIRLR